MSLSDKFGCYIQGHGDARKTDLPGDIKQLKQSFAEGVLFITRKRISNWIFLQAQVWERPIPILF